MAARDYTIIVVPRTRATLRKFHFSSKFFSCAFLAVAVLLLCAVGTIVHLYHQASNARRFEAENAQLKADLEQSQIFADKLNRKLSTLTNLSNRLKAIAGLPQPGTRRRSPNPGLGGVSIDNPKGDDPERLLELQTRAETLEKNLTWLHSYFSDRNLTPSMMPTDGYVSSRFGMRRNPFTNQPDFHQGIDITNNVGTRVIAPANGVVAFAGPRGTFGQVIELEHEGKVTTIYGHLARILVKPGQRIRRGQMIGLMGNTGMSSGPHLHYEVRVDNQPVNPKTYLDSVTG